MSTLIWEINPVPIQKTLITHMRPDTFPEIIELRKPPEIRNILPDKVPEIENTDFITCFEDLDPKKNCPSRIEMKSNLNSPYSSKLIRFALLLRYTSIPSSRMLSETYALASTSFLQKLHEGGVDSMKV